MHHLNQFIAWQVKNPRCAVNIKIETGKVSIWVYDYSLMRGMFVNSVDEIDILAHLKKDDIKQLEAIKRRHGGIYDDVVIPIAPGVDINLGNGGSNG